MDSLLPVFFWDPLEFAENSSKEKGIKLSERPSGSVALSKVPLVGLLLIVALFGLIWLHRPHLHAAEEHRPVDREVVRFVGKQPPCHNGDDLDILPGRLHSPAAEFANNGSKNVSGSAALPRASTAGAQSSAATCRRPWASSTPRVAPVGRVLGDPTG